MDGRVPAERERQKRERGPDAGRYRVQLRGAIESTAPATRARRRARCSRGPSWIAAAALRAKDRRWSRSCPPCAPASARNRATVRSMRRRRPRAPRCEIARPAPSASSRSQSATNIHVPTAKNSATNVSARNPTTTRSAAKNTGGASRYSGVAADTVNRKSPETTCVSAAHRAPVHGVRRRPSDHPRPRA